jgi:PAS domain S-box-containing protein
MNERRRASTVSWAAPAEVLVFDFELRAGDAAAALLATEFLVTVVATEQEVCTHLSRGETAALVVIQGEPGLSGAKLIAQIRRRWPLVQGLVVASYPDVGTLASDIERGAFEALPWADADLLALVRDAVRSHSAQSKQRTTRAQAERALRARERWYRVILEHAADGVLITDLHGDYIEANAAICRLLGYTRDEIVSLNVRNLVRPEQPAESLGLDAVLAGQTLRVRRRLQAKDGRLVAVETHVCLLPDGRLEALVREVAG